jgi:DNA-directed RNA polymerase subunit RPC12/RpoP
MANEVKVLKLPLCDIHFSSPQFVSVEAAYDTYVPGLRTWAFLCEECFTANNCELGIGKGQRLILKGSVVETNIVLLREMRCLHCNHQFTWIGHRLPTYCPECSSMMLSKPGQPLNYSVLLQDKEAELKYNR